MIRTAHIFCKIVDNYGDIGICWRLARQLAADFGQSVTLWVDDLPVFAKLEPTLDPAAPTQLLRGIEIRHWTDAFTAPPVLPDLVIETFSCRLPDALITAIKATPTPPRWINLDHISAEEWVDESHALTSIHPQGGLERLFLFPGFTDRSGGLIREHDLMHTRDAFQASGPAQRTWWEKNIPAPYPAHGTLKVSLFAYPFAPWEKLMSALCAHPTPITLLVPQSITHPALASSGNVTVTPYPMLTQEDFDRLLWSCDLNFVRGEDSWVRALWAGRPFVWQAYAQPEKAHEAKISAFLRRYTVFMPIKCAEALELAHGLWNLSARADEGALARLLNALPELAEPVSKASTHLAASEDCASRMMQLLNDRKK